MEYTHSYFPVSTSVDYLIYNVDTNELGVKLRTKPDLIYTYKDVPVNVWNAFRAVDSAGKFYSNEIKGEYTSGGRVHVEDCYYKSQQTSQFKVTYVTETTKTVDAKDYHDVLDQFSGETIVRVERV